MATDTRRFLIARAYGALVLAYGGGVLGMSVVPAFGDAVPFHVPFLITIVLSIPFVMTYTLLGLNSDDRKPPFDVQARWNELSRVCRWWPQVWYGPQLVILVSWVLFACGIPVVNPMHVFSGSLAGLCGLWFLLVYEHAARLFGEDVDFPTDGGRSEKSVDCS